MWRDVYNCTPGAFLYFAHGVGGPGDGERYHHHTVGQTFTCVLGKVRVTINGVPMDLEPGQSAYAPPNVPHGLLCLLPGSEYASTFFESDRDTIDWDRIKSEQVPALTPAEIAARAQHLTTETP